jgi:Phosphotransferase enzyme family
MTPSTNDPQFPQLPKILESAYMREVLQNALFRNKEEPTITIKSCSIGEKRHKPGKSFLLSYRLGLQHVGANVCHEQLMTAQLCRPGRGPSEFEACLEKQTQLPVGIPAVSFLPEVDMLLWAFPHDRKLVHLPKLLDAENLRTYFTKHCVEFEILPSEHVVSVQSEIMHYLPERSCMIRYTLAIADELSAGEPRQIILYGKNYRDGSGFETYYIMRQLAEQTSHCAKPYAYDAETRTLWQAHVPGEPFEWTSALATNHELIARVATCIAAFHSCTLDTTRFYGFSDISEQLQAACNIASVADPMLGEQVQAAVHAIRRNYKQLDLRNTVTTPIHLDLKMGNQLIADVKVFLIDMDCVQLGDPLVDVGSFVANLYLNGLRFGSDLGHIDEVVAIFCDKYSAVVDWFVDRAKLNWHIAAALIHEVVRRSLRQQNVERLKQVGAIIELSNRYSVLCGESINND